MRSLDQATETTFVNNIQLLNDISEMILKKGDPAKTMERILSLINANVKSLFLIYFYVDKKEDKLVLGSYTDERFRFVRHIVNFDVYKIHYPLKTKGPFICQCVNSSKIMDSTKLKDFFCPIFKYPRILDQIQKILGIKRCLGIPVKVAGETTGAIFVASRTDKISIEELETLELYANLAGIAIHNNYQFQQMEKQYEVEKTTTSILSHELKTPIAIAHNSAELISYLLRKNKDHIEPKIHTDLSSRANDIQESINRMARICNSIFSLREVEAIIPEDIHELRLDEQLEAIISNFEKKSFNKKIDFEVKIQKPDRKYYGGIVQLEQIMTILLDNAVKYTQKGKITLTIAIKNSQIRATVTDTGIGVPKRQYDKVFARFYRHSVGIRKRPEGLGLGLYVAKKIVTKLDGTITINKNPEGRGTQFTVKIPVYTSLKKR